MPITSLQIAALAPISQMLGIPLWAIILVSVWTFAWKGIALWKSARKNHLVWFVALLIINTMGILEILYIFLFSKIKLGKSRRNKK